MRRCWRREEVQESQGPRVQRSRGPKVPGTQGPRYLKLKFKYELDSKEGPSCFQLYLLCGLAWQGFQLTVELNTFDLFDYWQTQDGKTKESLIPFLLIYSRVGRLYNFISRLNETLTFICGEIKKDMWIVLLFIIPMKQLFFKQNLLKCQELQLMDQVWAVWGHQEMSLIGPRQNKEMIFIPFYHKISEEMLL